MMEEQIVDEQKLHDILEIWHRSGRGLINLPRITKLSAGIQISVVSIDNTIIYVYEKQFKAYRDVLLWYGGMIDKITN